MSYKTFFNILQFKILIQSLLSKRFLCSLQNFGKNKYQIQRRNLFSVAYTQKILLSFSFLTIQTFLSNGSTILATILSILNSKKWLYDFSSWPSVIWQMITNWSSSQIYSQILLKKKKLFKDQELLIYLKCSFCSNLLILWTTFKACVICPEKNSINHMN